MRMIKSHDNLCIHTVFSALFIFSLDKSNSSHFIDFSAIPHISLIVHAPNRAIDQTVQKQQSMPHFVKQSNHVSDANGQTLSETGI